MASSFVLNKTYGTSPGTNQASMSYMHLTANSAANNTSTAYQDSAAQITVPATGGPDARSYEAWFYPSWGGTYNSITSVKFWKSSGSLGTGVTINAGTTQNYATPVTTASSIATSAVPTAEGSAITPTVRGSAPTNTADFVVLQVVVTDAASPGDVGEQQYTWKWTES